MQTDIEKQPSLNMFPVPQLTGEKPNALLTSIVFDQDYLTRLRRGDEETAKHFDTYFRRVLRIKLWAKFGRAVQDDLMDDIMTAALEKILNGEPRDPACLAAYIRGICANLIKRPDPNTQYGTDVNFDQISDQALSAEEVLICQERARTVHSVLTSLKTRDRLILVDLFFNELDRDDVCRKYDVSRDQLRLILFRARGRFQKKWMPN
jgi:RNA polymerase sigma factor (sigma-70 family)